MLRAADVIIRRDVGVAALRFGQDVESPHRLTDHVRDPATREPPGQDLGRHAHRLQKAIDLLGSLLRELLQLGSLAFSPAGRSWTLAQLVPRL